jgi:hypothetical protein
MINLTAKREIGGNSDEVATYVVTRRLTFAPSWTPTAKTRLQLSLERSHRSFAGDPGFVLTASYAPHRSLLLSVSLNDEKRDSNYPGLVYNDRTTYVSAQFSF